MSWLTEYAKTGKVKDPAWRGNFGEVKLEDLNYSLQQAFQPPEMNIPEYSHDENTGFNYIFNKLNEGTDALFSADSGIHRLTENIGITLTEARKYLQHPDKYHDMWGGKLTKWYQKQMGLNSVLGDTVDTVSKLTDDDDDDGNGNGNGNGNGTETTDATGGEDDLDTPAASQALAALMRRRMKMRRGRSSTVLTGGARIGRGDKKTMAYA